MSTGPYDPNIQYGAAPASPTGPSTPMGTPAGAPPAYGMGGQYPAPGQAPSTPPSTKRKGIIALIAGLAVLSLLVTGGILVAYKDSGDSSDSAAGGSSASAGADSSGGKLGDKASKAAVGDCIDSLTDPSATIVSCDNASAKFKVVATSTTKESCVTTPGGDYFNAATCYNDLSGDPRGGVRQRRQGGRLRHRRRVRPLASSRAQNRLLDERGAARGGLLAGGLQRPGHRDSHDRCEQPRPRADAGGDAHPVHHRPVRRVGCDQHQHGLLLEPRRYELYECPDGQSDVL